MDVSGSEGRDPIDDFSAINTELACYSEKLARRPMIVAGNKCDLSPDGKLTDKLEKHVTELGHRFFRISAATHKGVKELMEAVTAELAHLPPIEVFEPDYVEPDISEADPEPDITQQDDVWIVEGGWMEMLVRNINFSDHESLMYFDRTLRNAGLFDRLEEMGIREGDTVSIYDLEFEYKK